MGKMKELFKEEEQVILEFNFHRDCISLIEVFVMSTLNIWWTHINFKYKFIYRQI